MSILASSSSCATVMCGIESRARVLPAQLHTATQRRPGPVRRPHQLGARKSQRTTQPGFEADERPKDRLFAGT